MNRARGGQGSSSARVAALAVAAALLAVACAGRGVPNEPPTDEPSRIPAVVAPTTPPPSPGLLTEAPAPAETSRSPSDPPLGIPAPSPGSAAPCSGSDDNRDFYRSVADAVSWDVYCPVLPEGWFVESGSWRLGGGGHLEIVYRGRGEARLELREGAFCAEASGCAPAGAEVGAAAFGDRAGALVAGDDGSWSVVVDRGAAVTWLLTGRGVDEAGLRAIGEALVRVARSG